MSFAIKGVPDADNLLMSQRPADVLGWLRRGFALLDSDSPELRRDAFLPLELAPDRELLSQLATALREAELHWLKCTKRMRSILRERLKLTTVSSKETITDLANFWRLLGAINCPAEIFAEARIFLKEFLRRQGSVSKFEDDEMRFLTDSVVNCVLASKPASTVQISFMQYLRGEKRLWSDRFVDSYIDCIFADLAGRKIYVSTSENRLRDTWCNAREELGEDLTRRADPATPTGRALIRSIARYLGLKASHSSNIEGAAALREQLWCIACPSSSITDDYGCKETLGELLNEWA